jgi:SAM-dependent methyltransferase
MYWQNSEHSAFGEFLPPTLAGALDGIRFSGSDENCSSDAVFFLPQPVPAFFKLEPHLRQRPTDQQIKQLIVQYYDALCLKSEGPAMAHTEYSAYMAMLDDFALQIVSTYAALKPLNILSVGAGVATREEIIATKFRRSICNLVVNDASREMCKKAASKGFDAVHGFFQDLRIEQQLIGFDVILALNCTEHLSSVEELQKFLLNISKSLTDQGLVLIDFFSLTDLSGWGSHLIDLFNNERLWDRGFQVGEYFYKRNAMEQCTYARYFERDRVVELLDGCGLEAVAVEYFNHSTGEINTEDEGSFILALRRKA